MLRIGILGASTIAPLAIIDPARRRNDVEVIAVAARSAQRASAFAKTHGIPRFYGDYEAVISDRDVDLVYVALPPSEHSTWTIRALQAGKHVLCEKPIAMNSAEARAMVAAADHYGCRLIEALHDRYHPLSDRIIEVVSSGRLGEIRTVEARFLANIPFERNSIRHVPALGGGALMDLGCYAIHWVRNVLREPVSVEATATRNLLGADKSVEARLRFASGAVANVFLTMTGPLTPESTLSVQGTEGTLIAENLVFPSRGHSLRETVAGVERTSTVEGSETYDHQLAAVVAALATGATLPTEGADILENMAVLDSIYEAAGFSRS